MSLDSNNSSCELTSPITTNELVKEIIFKLLK